ncbi:MAG TPA: DUF411 domain-containing protein [Vicinamibacterales bacterium]
MKKMFAAIVIAGMVSLGGLVAAQRSTMPTVEVFKSPTCGCCALWVKHLQANGFTTKVIDVEDMTEVKAKYGVPGRLQSCHTGVVNGYVLEGHVPASDVQRLIKERPQVAGVAVPGMPIGSPGMEQGSLVQPYNVLTFDKQGQTSVFASYGR